MKKIHVTSAILLLAARVSLRLASLETTRRLLKRIARIAHVRAEAQEIVRAIAGVARRLPRSPTCLHEALAGEALMIAAGHDCELRIGARMHNGTHAFHAWLESENIAVIGATEVEHAVFRAGPSMTRPALRES